MLMVDVLYKSSLAAGLLCRQAYDWAIAECELGRFDLLNTGCAPSMRTFLLNLAVQ
jgi:hypothetical protein